MVFLFARIGIVAVGAWIASLGWNLIGIVVATASINGRLFDRIANRVAAPDDKPVTAAAKKLHESAFVVDLHADVCAWQRDLMRRNRVGHVDLPRLREGGVALQFVTVPTKLVFTKKMPRLFLADLASWAFFASLEPPARWVSTAARARGQVARFERWIDNADGALVKVRDQTELAELRRRREGGEKVIGVMLGLEGAHALRGGIDVPWLAAKGFRVLCLSHFNDTRYGGSLHGAHKHGLTPAGRELVKELETHSITIDLTHSSEALNDDVLAMYEAGELSRPMIVSHTSVKGVHDHQRNITDSHAVEIARRGGLIGVTFFTPALPRCDIAAVVEATAYLVELLDEAGLDGGRHVAIGSDFDGAVKTVIDAAGWPLITSALLESGLSEIQVRQIIGGNALRFFEENLPAKRTGAADRKLAKL